MTARQAISGRFSQRHLAALCQAGVAIALLSARLASQTCNGTASGLSVAYERGKYQQGTSNGVAASFAGGHVAAGLSAAARQVTPELEGYLANGRLSIVLGSSRFQICPGLRLGFQHDTWEYEPGSEVTGTKLAASAGLNIGFEQPVTGGLSLAPFAGAHYRFSATDFSIGSPSAESTVGADTTTTVAIEYGLIARYRFIYGGVALDRTTDSKGIRPDAARWIIGFSTAPRRTR